MAPLFKSASFRSPKSIKTIKVGLAKIRGWSRGRQDSVCSTGSCASSTSYCTHPLCKTPSPSGSSEGSPNPHHQHGGNFYSPPGKRLFSGDEDEATYKDDVFTSEGKKGIYIPRGPPLAIRRGSAPMINPITKPPGPPESMISPIPDRLKVPVSGQRRCSAPEPKIPPHIQDPRSNKRRGSAPIVKATWVTSPFKSPKSIKSIKIGLAKLRGWSRRRQDSSCSSSACGSEPSNVNYCTHPLFGPGKIYSPSDSNEGSPTHGGSSTFLSPTATKLFSGDETCKDDVFTSEGRQGVQIPCRRPNVSHRGSAPTIFRLPKPLDVGISPIPDHLRHTKTCQRRSSVPEHEGPCNYFRKPPCSQRRGSAPALVKFPKPKDEAFVHIPPRLADPKNKSRRGSAPAIGRFTPTPRTLKHLPPIPPHKKSSLQALRRGSSPSIGYMPPLRGNQRRCSTPTIDQLSSIADLNGSFNRGSPNIMPGVSEATVNEAVSSLSFPTGNRDFSRSLSFQLPDVNESHTSNKEVCHCMHVQNKENYVLSPSLSEPVDVPITLPRTPHKTPVAEDTFKTSSTVICDDGSTRCALADRRGSSQSVGYMPFTRGKQHITFQGVSPNVSTSESSVMPEVTETVLNEAVSSLRFPKESGDISSSSWTFHLPDIKESYTTSANMCHSSHLKNKENVLSPNLSGPSDVTITLPRTTHKSPVAEDTFKTSPTIICDDGSTRCGHAVRSKSHQTQSADGLLTLSDLDSPTLLPISVPQQKNDVDWILQNIKSMGIKDEFHQKAILVCIDQLQNGRHDGDSTGPGVGDCSTPASHHTLRNHSFHDLHRCDKCGLYLRGFIHQGQFCQDCGLIAHRTCAATGLPPCVRQSSSYFRRILLSSVFGLSLCTQFNPGESMAPLLLVRCCEELLYRAKSDSSLDLYRLYRTPPQQDALAKLREACDDDISNADLSLHEPHVIAYLIKRYLRELPEPVIPENCYDRFIGAAQIDNDEQCARSITQLVKELNPHHYYTLKFLMTHFLQLCQLQVSRGNKDPPTLLIQSLCHVLLRPPWDKIVELARNTDYHMRIVEMLLLKVDWGEKVPSFPSAPALPPRIRPRQSGQSYSSSGYDPVDPIISPSSPPMGMPIMPIAGPLPVTNIPSDAPKALQESEWYWGNITRDDVNVLMRDAKDGTFLVRDASTGNNEYTLTVRKGGSNKLIKICHRNGMYGFIEPLNFNSVVDLINYCQQQNLSQFNKALDIKLLYPVSRNTYGDESESRGLRVEEILSILADYNKQYKEKTIQWNICYEKQQIASQEIQNYRQALESFNEMIAWLQDHLDLHDKLKLEAQPHEVNELSVNRGVLQERIEQVRDAQSKYTLHLNNTMTDCRAADRTCNSMKMECSQLMKMRDQLKNVLLSRGISADMIDKWLEQADPHQPQPIQPLAELHNESLWLHENCTREEAQNILRGRPDGTFLIRMAQNGGYALSIACNKEVQHCRIYQGENGFGFAEPFLIYATLRDLVLHYSKNSLLMHNDLLNTTLNFPARPGS